MEIELWLPINQVLGYEISNLGRVRSVDRNVINSRSLKNFTKKGKLLALNTNKGYNIITIKNKPFKVHRLVAEAFLDNANKYDVVNHINGIRNDNRVENLEWCTISENNVHSFRVLGRKHPMIGKKGALHHCSKKVICSTLDYIFNSVTEAANMLNCDASTIIKVCNGTERFTKGFYFRWA